ncbi:hypothetical protein GQ600_17065 [Phytophthora cactorum]|nr:hypothetical protein GQ600_17065 [Phytophthora cactorum]
MTGGDTAVGEATGGDGAVGDATEGAGAATTPLAAEESWTVGSSAPQATSSWSDSGSALASCKASSRASIDTSTRASGSGESADSSAGASRKKRSVGLDGVGERRVIDATSDRSSRPLKNPKTPGDLFTLLRLDRAGNSLLENAIIDAWIKCADNFREMHARISMDPISTIEYHYSNEAAAKMVVEATKSKDTANIAYRLNTEPYWDWLTGGTVPAQAFKLLKLNSVGDKIFQSSLLVTWMNYVDFYSKGRQHGVIAG